MFVSFVANLFHEFVGDLGSFVRPGGMHGAITITVSVLVVFSNQPLVLQIGGTLSGPGERP